MTHIGDEERRRRIGVRHRLAPGSKASSLREAAASMVALHATDPAGLFLEAVRARGEVTTADLRALDPRLDRRITTSRGDLVRGHDRRRLQGRLPPRARRSPRTRPPRATWISGQFRWSPTERWLPGGIRELTVDAEAERLAAWLGPTRIRWPFPPA